MMTAYVYIYEMCPRGIICDSHTLLNQIVRQVENVEFYQYVHF